LFLTFFIIFIPQQCCGSGSESGSDPQDPHVFEPPGSGSGSVSQRYGSGSGSFNHQAKKIRKTLIPTALPLLFEFLSLKMMNMYLQKVISKKKLSKKN
jgi:hypothetical protein